jgi:hypothetical protein
MTQSLKAGTIASFQNSMALYMEEAMRKEWRAVRGEDLRDDDRGAEDRRIMFAAVAQGVLRYLFDHNADLVSTLEIPDGWGRHYHEMNFTISGYQP